MLRKLLVPALALVALPTIASAQFEAGDYELTLAGRGEAPKSVSGGFYGVTGSFGYFLTKEAEVGVRQSVDWINKGVDIPNQHRTTWGGATNAVFDYHFDFGALQPFVGVFGGYEYRQGVTGFWDIGPEVGVKYFVNGTTFLYGQVGYSYNLNKPTDSFFNSNIGVGFRF